MSLAFKSVLIIDEMPLIIVGLMETIRSMQPAAQFDHAEHVLTVLSSPAYEKRSFDLIILGSGRENFLGSGEDNSPGNLLLPAAELKEKFPDARLMIYTEDYDPALIGKIGDGIDACVHKHEGADEIRTAWLRLLEGECYLSPMLHSLYVLYRLNR
jgi:DNA-binding NarL/FixJ family response regulator